MKERKIKKVIEGDIPKKKMKKKMEERHKRR